MPDHSQYPVVPKRYLNFVLHPGVANFYDEERDRRKTPLVLLTANILTENSDNQAIKFQDIPEISDENVEDKVLENGPQQSKLTTKLDEFDFWFDYI